MVRRRTFYSNFATRRRLCWRAITRRQYNVLFKSHLPLLTRKHISPNLAGFSAVPQSDKLRKLSQRVAPSMGPAQLATFPHLQEFFLKFLLDANHYAFSSQVCFTYFLNFNSQLNDIFFKLLAVSVDKLYILIDTFKDKPKSK
jgi:hypothetical protein